MNGLAWIKRFAAVYVELYQLILAGVQAILDDERSVANSNEAKRDDPVCCRFV